VIGPDNRACEVVPFLGVDVTGGRVDQSPIVAGLAAPLARA
jgi:hypothetical protein